MKYCDPETINNTKIPRPLNSFMIFRQKKQREIAQQCPGASHRDMSKIISKWWRELSMAEKQIYIDQAEKAKQEHKLKYPNYKFNPNRNVKPKRTYKKHPENELVARDFGNMQKLLSLYHHGTSSQEESNQLQTRLEEDLMGQTNSSVPVHQNEYSSASVKPVSIPQPQQNSSTNWYLPMPLDMMQIASESSCFDLPFSFQTTPAAFLNSSDYMPFNVDRHSYVCNISW